MEHKKPELRELALPASLVGQGDLARLIREAESLDGVLQAQKVRGGEQHMPNLSQSFSDFLEANKIENPDGQTLTAIKERLRVLKEHSPVVHLTFASEVDPELLQKLVAWLRTEAHPHTLVSVGLQPSLIGGVYMRTPNHVYDFSLRALLKDKQGIMLKQVEALGAR